MDLRPENVLVTRINNSTVGRWQVSDFGISVFKLPSSADGQYQATASPTFPKRGPGKFTAPEFEDETRRLASTKSDVWSFGGILAYVLAFAWGGPRYVGN